MKHLLGTLALGLGLCAGAGAAQAATQSFQGQFSQDDDLFSTRLWLSQDDVLSVQTFSFAGGLNAAGTAIAAGGFAPVLALFFEDGELLQLALGSSHACAVTCWDAGFSMALPAGHYTLVLSQDGNLPAGYTLSDGYSQAGQPDYTGLSYLGQPGQSFIQIDGTQRTGEWALDVQLTNSVPEPSTVLLWLAGAGALLVQRRRQQGAST